MRLGHVHRINVGFVEEGRRYSYDRWYNDLVDGSDLTLMTCFEVPCDIFVK